MINRKRLVAGCVVAVVIGTEAVVLSGSGDAAADTVTGYFQAAMDENCPAAFDRLTDPIRGTFGSQAHLCELARADTLVSFQVGDSVIAADTATVTVTLVRPNLTLTDRARLTTVDGQWRISSFEVIQSEHGHGRP